MKKCLVTLVIIITSFSIFAQDYFKEFESKYNLAKEDTAKIEILITYLLSNDEYQIFDSVHFQNYLNDLEELIIKNSKSIPAVYFDYLARIYINNGNIDKTNEIYDLAINRYKEEKNDKLYCNFLNDKAYNYSLFGYHDKAIETQLELITYIEDKKLTHLYARVYLIMGFIYRNYEKYNDALHYFKKSTKFCKKDDEKNILNYAYNEIGNVFNFMEQMDSAIYYHSKSLEIRERIGDSGLLAFSYNDLASDYMKTGDLNTAKNYFIESYKILKSDPNNIYLPYIVSNLVDIYLNLNNLDSIKIFLKQEEQLAKKYNNKNFYQALYRNYSRYYYLINEYKKAYDNLVMSNEYKDSIFTDESKTQVLNWEKKYEIQKRDKEIFIVNEKLKRQRVLTISFLSVLLLIAFFTFLVIKQLNQKRKAYKILENKNNLILEQKAEIEVQKETIETYNKHINDSINYAKNIQNAILSPKSLLDSYFDKNFILYLPKDIVSGDFYWFSKINSIHIIVVADCTGHGVPGAFMSVLGITLLNEIHSQIISKNIDNFDAAFVLESLRTLIMQSLRQKYQSFENSESIDMSICLIDKTENQIQFAGANNSVFLHNGNELIEHKPDKMTVGISLRTQQNFSNKIFSFDKGNKLYMFTDGFADQFGGQNIEKFTKKRFKELVSKASEISISSQRDFLNNRLIQWQNNNIQTDDILVVGIEL